MDAFGHNQRSSSAVEVELDVSDPILESISPPTMLVGVTGGEGGIIDEESSGVGSTSPTGSPQPNSPHHHHHENEVQEDYEHVYCQLDPYFVSFEVFSSICS